MFVFIVMWVVVSLLTLSFRLEPLGMTSLDC